GRIVRSLEFGTNSSGFASGGDMPTLDTNYPPRWDTTTSEDPIVVEVVYNDRGMIDRVIDPMQRITSLWYDDLNRRIAMVENHVSQVNISWDDVNHRWQVSGNSTETDEDRVTTFVH